MKFIINIGRKALIYLLLLPLYWFSFFVPRSKVIWVFGSWFGHRYTDNSRHLYDYICMNHPSIRAIWLTHEKSIVEKVRSLGREAYLINSWSGYWISCRAALVIVSGGGADVNRVGISRAKGLQLYHGIALKKIMLDDRITRYREHLAWYRVAKRIWHALFPFTHTLTKWNAIISTSPFVSERFASAYGVNQSNVKVTGYPRNDILLRPNPAPIDVIVKLKTASNADKVICYVPTHRGAGQDSLDILFSSLDIRELEACLVRHNAVMLLKMHYYHQESNPFADMVHHQSRIHWLSAEESPELNPLLPFVDVLITDYSSAYIDYLLLDRPVVFAPFDLEQYLANDRELYEDYDSSTPGPKCISWEEVINALDDVFSGTDQYKDARKQAISKYHSYVDANSCQRVYEVALELVNG